MCFITPSRTEADYQAALARAEVIFQAQPGELEFDELDILATLIEAYEARHYPIPEPDPIEYIKYKMTERGLRQRDLAAWLGGENRVSEHSRAQAQADGQDDEGAARQPGHRGRRAASGGLSDGFIRPRMARGCGWITG